MYGFSRRDLRSRISCRVRLTEGQRGEEDDKEDMINDEGERSEPRLLTGANRTESVYVAKHKRRIRFAARTPLLTER